MSVITCSKCGGLTNTAVSNWLDPMRKDNKANECYLKRNQENTKWVRGCTKADGFMITIVEEMIKEADKPGDENKKLGMQKARREKERNDYYAQKREEMKDE